MIKTAEFINEGYKPKMTEAQAMEFKNATNINMANVSEEEKEAMANEILAMFEPFIKKMKEVANKKVSEQTKDILNMYEPNRADASSYAIYSAAFSVISIHCEALTIKVKELAQEVESLKKGQPEKRRGFQLWR